MVLHCEYNGKADVSEKSKTKFHNLSMSESREKNIDQKINTYSKNIPILEDDTKNIIEYVEQSSTKKKKKFNFWKLLETNE